MKERSQNTGQLLRGGARGSFLLLFFQGIFFLAADEGLWDVPCGTAHGFIGLWRVRKGWTEKILHSWEHLEIILDSQPI